MPGKIHDFGKKGRSSGSISKNSKAEVVHLDFKSGKELKENKDRIETAQSKEPQETLQYGEKSEGFIGFKSETDRKTKDETLERLKAADSLIAQILAEIHDIGELIGHSKIAKVENLKSRIEQRYKKIYEYLNQPEGKPGQEMAAGRNQKQGPPVEEHPKLPPLGGMDIDKMDQDYLKEMGIDPKLDKTEIENQLKNKLQAKLKAAMKVSKDLRAELKQKLVNKPKQKAANKLLVNYEKKLQLLMETPVLKPEAPAPKLGWEPPKLTPH